MNPPLPSSVAAGLNKPSPKTTFVVWLRKTHGWIGLWGATLGLLFGISGIWLNHRSVLQLPIEQARSNSQLALPEPIPVDAQALAAWLQSALQIRTPASNVRVEAAKPVAWLDKPKGEHAGKHGDGGRSRARENANDAGTDAPASAPALVAAASAVTDASVLMQPEHWTISFGGPKETIQVEYWAGNRSVSVRRTANGIIGTLTNLHKGIGMPVAWILLVDTLAGSMILLSLTGLALWMLTRRRRVAGLAILGTALAVTGGLALAHF